MLSLFQVLGCWGRAIASGRKNERGLIWRTASLPFQPRLSPPSFFLLPLFSLAPTTQICPEMQVNEIHALYDKHRKVSYFVESHQNTHNSVKYELIWKWHFVMLIHKEHWISLTYISGHKCYYREPRTGCIMLCRKISHRNLQFCMYTDLLCQQFRVFNLTSW